MARSAPKSCTNKYYIARMNTAKFNERLYSREGASEETGIERTRLARIETGSLIAYPEEILILADAYSSPELCNYYCSNHCAIGRVTTPEVNLKSVESSAINLFNVLKKSSGIGEELLAIAEDGIIDEFETVRVGEIVKILEHIERESIRFKTLVKKMEMEGE